MNKHVYLNLLYILYDEVENHMKLVTSLVDVKNFPTFNSVK